MKKLIWTKKKFVNKNIFKNKKFIIISSIILSLIIAIILILIFHEEKIEVNFNLIGDEIVELEVFSEYKDEGYNLIVNNEKIKKGIKIKNNVNVEKIGSYKVIYSYIDQNEKKYEIYRTVNIVDKTPPVITLKGETEINMLVGEKYVDPGYEVIDNYDDDLNSLVEVDGVVNYQKEGEYILKYKVSDLSGNMSLELSRKVIVKKPKKIVTKTETKSSEKNTDINSITSNTNNTIIKNKFTSSGIYYEGYAKNSNGSYKLKLVSGSNEIIYDMNPNGNNNFSGEINLANISNDVYNVYVISNEEERLLNKMEGIDRIARSKIGDKLITVNYDNNNVSITVENFNYQYDILIDPGHGGSDSGTSNAYIYEKEMNLRISLYEKCRYEEHGLSVFMIRTDDSYGVMLGDASWKNLSRRGYAIGYYGAVSRLIYSNHHNSSTSSNLSGFEILTPSKYDNINAERNIVSKFRTIYPLTEEHKRTYARDYDSGIMYSTANGENYNSVRDYYAVIRIPYELFNTKVVIYEGIYMSNNNDFNWYWNDGNWKNVSEMKISEYVSSLGKSYNSSTTCS